MSQLPLNIPCTVCGKLDSHCFSQVPTPPGHLQWIRENTVYDGRSLEECKTHEDRMSMGHLYIGWPNREWNRAIYDADGIEETLSKAQPVIVCCATTAVDGNPAAYLTWLRRFRRSDQPVT